MDICKFSESSEEETISKIVYMSLMIEYSVLLIFLIIFLKRSYKSPKYNFSEYRNYLYLIILSSMLKIALFFSSCITFGRANLVLIVAYELPIISSETLLVYLWRVMYFDLISNFQFINTSKRQTIEFYLIITFNILMYLTLLVIILLIFTKNDINIHLFTRIFKSFLEVLVCIAIFYSGIKLLIIVKKFQSVPKNLLFWIIVGAGSSLLKSFEQLFFYYTYDQNIESTAIEIAIFISYNIDDLLPTVVFLNSFQVYYRFIKQDDNSLDSFDRSLSRKLNTIEIE